MKGIRSVTKMIKYIRSKSIAATPPFTVPVSSPVYLDSVFFPRFPSPPLHDQSPSSSTGFPSSISAMTWSTDQDLCT